MAHNHSGASPRELPLPSQVYARPRTATAKTRSSSGAKIRAEPKKQLALFGARLHTRRLAAGLTQADLAKRAKLDVSYVSQLERGLRDPSLSSLAALADAFGLSMAEFFDDASSAPIVPQVRVLVQEFSVLDEQARRDAVEILRRFCRAVVRASTT